MDALSKEIYDHINADELENLAANIEQKLKLLDIKLPKLAELAEVDYFTLRKIINREPSYMPNLRIISKLADFFSVNSGDLIKSGYLPQYVPSIQLEQVKSYLNDQVPEFDLEKRVFVDSYIHQKAFSIKNILKHFHINALIEHICYPSNKFFKNGIFLIESNYKLMFIQIITIKDNIIFFKQDESDEVLQKPLEEVSPIAVVVKFLLNQTLI